MSDQYQAHPGEFIYAETPHNSFVRVHRKNLQYRITSNYRQAMCGEISSVVNGMIPVLYDISAVMKWINSNMISEHGFNEMMEWFKIR